MSIAPVAGVLRGITGDGGGLDGDESLGKRIALVIRPVTPPIPFAEGNEQLHPHRSLCEDIYIITNGIQSRAFTGGVELGRIVDYHIVEMHGYFL
jgi:hypothetical protein